ncbi:MAG: M48 family metalloprotease [Armatimonadetes bacterium]|nr:M48 family metalloprotease [Armatimonadota bacterium]
MMDKAVRLHIIRFALAWVVVAMLAPSAAWAKMKIENEIKKGQEAVVEVEKESKVVTDPELNKRVNTIGQAIAAVVDEKRFAYTFKILDEKDVNAFSLPGGFIYVNKGLLDYVRSDDELAGVLAHEITHAAHHHMVQMIEEQGKMSKWMDVLNLAVIAVMMSSKGNTEGAFNVLTTLQLVQIAKVTGLGRKAEFDADAGAIKYLKRTGYNPAGMYTFMARLSNEARLRPDVDYGIFQTHPISADRVARIEGYLEEMNIPINTRVVLNLKSTVKSVQQNGREIGEVYYQDKLIYKTDPATAAEVSDRINRLLWANLKTYELKLDKARNMVVARNIPIITPTPQDAALNDTTIPDLTARAYAGLRQALYSEYVKNGLSQR